MRLNSVVSLLRRLRWIAMAALAAGALAGCGGGSGGGGTAPPPTPPPPSGSVVVSGKITFDRIAFREEPGQGLDADNPVQSPARHVVVEAVDGNTVLASTVTDELGEYSLAVPAGRSMFIRAKAQMLKNDAAPTWNFRVRNNASTSSSPPLYALDGSTFNSGTADSIRDLHAATGWNGTSYASIRPAAPFAILDTVYQAKELILTAQPGTQFPELSLFWSPQNRDSDVFCPRQGDIISSIYITFGPPFEFDQCTPENRGIDGIYILGAFANGAGDTDEFDQHVIAHEFGHYIEDVFSRSDSLGGDHGIADRLDLRVAFSEGWGNAFAAMVLDDPVYRDSFRGFDEDFGPDMRNGQTQNRGWYSEGSVHRILWKAFDSDTASGGLDLGFGPIFSAMASAQHRATDALASLYTFIAAFNVANPASASSVNALVAAEQISGSGPFAASETNNAGSAHLLPIYTRFDLPGSGQVQLCGTRQFGVYNKAGNRRFLRLEVAQQVLATITVQGPATFDPVEADPDILLWQRGILVETAELFGTQEMMQLMRSPGTYVAEIYDYSHVGLDLLQSERRGDTCMTVSVAGS